MCTFHKVSVFVVLSGGEIGNRDNIAMAKSQSSISMLILSNRGILCFPENFLKDHGMFSRQNETSTDCIEYEFSSTNDINIGDSNEQV